MTDQPTLLDQIRDGTLDSTASIAPVLRRCLILASRAGAPELEAWANRELSGYGEAEPLPSYREASVVTLGHFFGPGRAEFQSLPIPIGNVPEQFQDRVRTAKLTKGIGTYEKLIAESSKGSLVGELPVDLARQLEVLEGYTCVKAWQVIPIGILVDLVETVRNRVLQFALEIQKTNPSAGSAVGAAAAAAVQEQFSQVFHTTIMGSVENFAAGSTNVTQQVTINVTKGDFDSLAKSLSKQGVDEVALEDLRLIVAEEPADPPRASLGKRALSWVAEQSARLAVEVPLTTAVECLMKALLAYYGIKVLL